MKTVFRVVLLNLSILLLGACSQHDFEFSDGSRKSVSSYEGGWLLINYWAIWCKPCVKEVPELNLLDREQGVSVIGVNFDRQTGEDLDIQLEKLNIRFPTLVADPAIYFAQETPSALPATMVIDSRGEFHSWLMGPQTAKGILSKLKSNVIP